MRKIRLLSVAFVAALVVTALGGPALASSDPIPDVKATGPHVKGAGTATPVAPINPEQQLVQFSCRAVATGVISATTVDSCKLYVDGVLFGVEPPATTLPGNVSQTVPVVAATRIGATLKVCWEASARPPIGPPVYDDSTYRCTTINTLVAA